MAEIATPSGEALLDDTPPHIAPPLASAGYRRYVLWLLLLVYIVNFFDRQVINILVEPIKAELHLLDWQAGLLSGLAFGIVYTLLAFPMARLADRHHRGLIIAGCLGAWSLFTGACGLAQNFLQLALARGGVGIGEAGCVPTSHALIADVTPKEKRATALSIFAMGTPLGALLGLAIGGVMADMFGWRRAFLVAAVPGIALAIVCALTLREPRVRLREMMGPAQVQVASFGETLRYLAQRRAFWWLGLGAGVRAFLGYGHAPFIASFFYRAHGAQVADLAARFHIGKQGFVGVALGLTTGIGGAFGSWLGGHLADRLGGRDLRIFGTMPALAVLVSFPFTVWLYTTQSAALGLCLYFIPATLATLWYGPVYAAAQGVAPPHMRAMSASIMLFLINFLGLVLGAIVIGALSDALNKGLGLGPADGLRWALVGSTTVGLIGALFFWFARDRIRQEIVS
jgi:MFS family permease